MEWYYVWWPWLTAKRIARVCQHQLSFLYWILLHMCKFNETGFQKCLSAFRTILITERGPRWSVSANFRLLKIRYQSTDPNNSIHYNLYKCFKIYQFKTQRKGDIHSCKTANIILPGLTTVCRWTALRVQNRMPVQMRPRMLVETTRVTEFEYFFACIHVNSLPVLWFLPFMDRLRVASVRVGPKIVNRLTGRVGSRFSWVGSGKLDRRATLLLTSIYSWIYSIDGLLVMFRL